MAKFTSKPMTYARLWDVLSVLGFDRIDAAEYIVFRLDALDALIALPIRDPNAKLHFWHHAGSRKNVVMRGVASEEVFERLLAKPAIVEAVSKSKRKQVDAVAQPTFIRPRRKNSQTATVKTTVRKVVSDMPSLAELHAEKS